MASHAGCLTHRGADLADCSAQRLHVSSFLGFFRGHEKQFWYGGFIIKEITSTGNSRSDRIHVRTRHSTPHRSNISFPGDRGPAEPHTSRSAGFEPSLVEKAASG
nr:hypothetical protein [Candidatus Sigynarchaeum springense]